MFDRGSNFWIRWKPAPTGADEVTFALHPLGMQRLQIGEAPIAFGGNLGRLQQQLADLDTGAGFDQEVFLGGLLASIQLGALRLHFRGLLRPAEFFELERAHLTLYRVAPVTESRFGTLGRLTAEWAFGDKRPRLGLGVGLHFPASTFTATTNLRAPVGTFKHLDLGSTEPATGLPGPIFDARATMSWQPHPLGGIALELKYVNDPSRAILVPSSAFGTSDIVADDPARVYASLLLQLRI